MTAERGVNGAGVVTKLSSRSVADTVSRLTDMIAAKGMKTFAVKAVAPHQILQDRLIIQGTVARSLFQIAPLRPFFRLGF